MAEKNDRYDSLENWAIWSYLRGTLEWPVNRIAYELDLNEQRLLEWVNENSTKMSDLARANPEKVAKMRADIEKRYPPEPEDEPKVPKITIRKAVELLTNGKTLNEIAKIAKCPEPDFKTWWNQNLALINIEYRKLVSAQNIL
jgi:hypothetical protein